MTTDQNLRTNHTYHHFLPVLLEPTFYRGVSKAKTHGKVLIQLWPLRSLFSSNKLLTVPVVQGLEQNEALSPARRTVLLEQITIHAPVLLNVLVCTSLLAFCGEANGAGGCVTLLLTWVSYFRVILQRTSHDRHPCCRGIQPAAILFIALHQSPCSLPHFYSI